MSLQTDSSQSNQNSSPPGRQGLELRGRIMRWYALFAILLLAGALFLGALTKNRLEEGVKTALSARAQTGAQKVNLADLDVAALHYAIGLDAGASLFVLSPAGEILDQYNGPLPAADTTRWLNWQRQQMRKAVEIENGAFLTKDPDNDSWLGVVATAPDGAASLFIQQPASVAFEHSTLIIQSWIIALAMFLTGGLFSWWLVSRQIITPLEQLEAYSGLVRWRGQMRSEEQAQIESLAQRGDQIGSLSRALMAMEADVNQRFLQLSTLLETSRVVAASLDLTVVIDNILDQVQNLFGTERCAVVVLDKRANVFRVRASRGLTDEYVQTLRIAPSEPNSTSMRALRSQTPIQVANTETDLTFAAFRPRAQIEGYQSVLAIPLHTQHAPPAVLLLYKEKPYRYSFSELELASIFGNHASMAMENAALFERSDEQLQEQTRRLEAIVESLQDGLILESNSGRVLYCNQRTTEWLGMSRLEMRLHNSEALTRRLLAAAIEPETAQRLFTDAGAGTGPRSFDLVYESENDRPRDLRIHLFDVNDVNGEPLGRGQLWQDITVDKELDRMKSTLLSTVSHELRTPLATIKGYASTLLASDVEWDAQAQREFLKTISDETDRMAKLVKNLLDMSRIDAGLLNMNCELYSLHDLLKEVAQGFNPPLAHRLQIYSDPDIVPISMDLSRIGTAIRNLLENAVKYSPPDKPIDLTIEQQDGTILFSVRDYGPGVPVEYQEKIFDHFVRADNRLTRQVGGTGLGLAICKGFVEAHNGRVWVRSAQPGAIFGFSLPIEEACEG